ncbi:hypothetical protein, partial [Mesorhizobium sp. M3A.F.Ca.ET.201.01.1.1]|uniref:hypothetical protein n=1 Tax=Mesorhizobium sp. M3A.F.Ca.ET.201.01.1.1 TaxID=2563946 RepID=UPI001AEE9565
MRGIKAGAFSPSRSCRQGFHGPAPAAAERATERIVRCRGQGFQPGESLSLAPDYAPAQAPPAVAPPTRINIAHAAGTAYTVTRTGRMFC